MNNKNNILNESVEQNKIIDAIKKRYEVRVNYKADDDTKGGGERIIQPVAYGLSKSGNPVVRAFQPFGDTKTKVPHWKLFRLDKFESWKPLKNRKFVKPPVFPYESEGEFNPNGDKSMSEVYIIADFKGAKDRYERGGLKKYNDDRTNRKNEENPYNQLKTNIKKSVMATPEIMKRVAEWQKNKPQQMRDYLNGKNTKEMEMTQNFGDENIVQTTGPVNKTNQTGTQQTEPIKKSSYQKLQTNGPVTKNKENLKQQDELETSNDVENLVVNNEINNTNNREEHDKQ